MIIKDVLGKIIMKEKINSNNQSINLNGQKEGIYFLMIENTENIIPLIKFKSTLKVPSSFYTYFNYLSYIINKHLRNLNVKIFNLIKN